MAILCAGLGALFLSLAAKAQSNYLVPLPQKGNVIALNNSGQVLYDSGLLTGNTFTAFPAGFTAPAGSPAILGESGVVAGNTTTGHLAIYSAGTVTDLGVPPWQFAVVIPAAINASGQIVGYTGPGVFPPFFYNAGVFNPININNPDVAGVYSPDDLNDSGQIVVCGPSRAGGSHGFLIIGSVLTDLGPQCPSAINASGQITGSASKDSGKTSHAYIWANGTLTLLAEPPAFIASRGDEINKGGQIVGAMSAPSTSGGSSSVPFFYNGVMTDINSLISASDPLKSSVTIGSVVDINDSRLLLLLSTVPVVGSSTAYLLQAPWLDVAPGPLTFANQGVGTASQPQTLTLTNSGTVPLPLDSVSIPANATEFSQTNACPASLAAGANCMVSVTFAPSVAGVQNAVLNVVTDGATIAVSLAGTAPITISLSASPVSPTVGQPFTITWTATPGSTCQSSGGTANDGWRATTASGSVSVTEAGAGADTYSMTCAAGPVSATQSLEVTVANPPPPPSGGKGALDPWAVVCLGCLLVINLWRRWEFEPTTCRPVYLGLYRRSTVRFIRTIRRVLALVAVLLPITTLAQTPALVDMGVSRGNGLNNSGQVALQSGIYSTATRTVTPLPLLPGGSNPAAALAINATGQVTGTASSPPTEYGVAIFYSSPTLTDLGVPCGDPSVDYAEGRAINSSGVAVGWGGCRGGTGIQGWMYQAGTTTTVIGLCHPLNTLYFYGINDNGQITGTSATCPPGGGGMDAVIYQNGMWTDLGPGTGYAINNAGQVTGALTATANGVLLYTHVLLYSGGNTRDLGVLRGGVKAVGSAINSTGQIVGSSDLAGATGTHALFYNGVLTDLNTVIATNDPLKSFVTLVDATGINDQRLIVTNGTDSRDGQTHAYLLQAPWIDITPGPLTFPTETVGAVSPPQSVTVTNAGTTAVSLGAPSTSADFNFTNNCGASLAAAAACTIQVTFAPQASGDRAGSLNFTSNAVPFAVPLSGTAPIAATISANPTTVTTGTPTKLTWTLSAGTTCTATGGQAGDGWTGNITASGSQSVTETTARTYTYGLQCAAGSQSASPMTTVTMNWPPITVKISASPTTFAAGQSTTLTWSSTNATSCAATGGGANDNWPGNKMPSGSQVVTEAYVPAGPSLTLTFTLSCTSSMSQLSNQASAQAVETASQPANSGGGGGAFDLLALVGLLSLVGRSARRRGARGRCALGGQGARRLTSTSGSATARERT